MNWPATLAILCKKEGPEITLFLSVLQLMIRAVALGVRSSPVPLHTSWGWHLPQPAAHPCQVGRPGWEVGNRWSGALGLPGEPAGQHQHRSVNSNQLLPFPNLYGNEAGGLYAKS